MATETIHENKKHRDLLKTARELFFKHGSKRVTVEEICEKADVSKMTFYKFFRNKDDLLMKIMQEWSEEGRSEYIRILSEPISFIDKIENFIRLRLEKIQEYSDDFFNEMLESNEQLKEFVIQVHGDYRERMIELFRQGQDEGIIRKNISPEFYLFLIDHFSEMFYDDELKAILPDIHDRYGELMNFLFYGFNECDKQMKEWHK